VTETREYNSPLREQAKAETRDKIAQAVVRVVLDDGIAAFTVQNVAHKAGVSHRTVYRHFETREELLDGLAQYLEALATDAAPVPSTPSSVDDIIDGVTPSFLGMTEIGDVVRAYVITSIALRWQDRFRQQRSVAFEKVTRAAFPHLSAAELREAGALIRSLASSRSWYQLTEEGGLDGSAAARATEWAVRALFKDLRSRDRAAAKRNPRN
jgi:AcrR family transcriptional regulator